VGDPYEILGVARGATSQEIERAFRILAYMFHPDRYRDAPPAVQKEAERQMQRINVARDDLLAMLQGRIPLRVGPRSREEKELLEYLQALVDGVPKHQRRAASRVARVIVNDRRLGRAFLDAMGHGDDFAAVLAHTAARLLEPYLENGYLLDGSANDVASELGNPKYGRNRKWGLAVRYALLN
jgi:DnaJ domain